MSKYNFTINKSILWVAVYFGIMLLYTFLDVAIWRRISPQYSNWLNIITIMICVYGFLLLLSKTGYRIALFSNITFTGILLSIGCSILFFLLLDLCLDPIFESIFPASEQNYQDAIQTLRKSPITSLLQICIIAPVVEEVLMRGFTLGGLKTNYGNAVALLVSSFLFALLHFNMVQTISAFIAGIILGLLYIKTNSILSCILAHCGYNLISYLMIYLYCVPR